MIEDICNTIVAYRFSRKPVCGGPMYAFGDGPKGFDPIDPYLGGGLYLDLNKSRPNTTILREDLGEGLQNLYVHHDRGPGRIDPLCDKTYDKEPIFDPQNSPLNIPPIEPVPEFELPAPTLPGPDAFMPNQLPSGQLTLDDWMFKK